MSAPIRTEELSEFTNAPSMYAPPWARDEARAVSDAGLIAADKALAASEELRRTLPPAAPLGNAKRRREPAFEGDIAVRHLRERPTLDPMALAPPVRKRGVFGMLARTSGAIGLAALAAIFVVGAIPQPIDLPQTAMSDRIVAQDEAVAFTERVAALTVSTPVEQPAVAVAVAPAAAPVLPAPPPAPTLRALDREEITMLYRRSEELVRQGDIASARLMLSRAAESGDARSALALGATYDADVLRKLGVIGVAADAAQARAWYAKAAEFGSGEATKRLEQLAQSMR